MYRTSAFVGEMLLKFKSPQHPNFKLLKVVNPNLFFGSTTWSTLKTPNGSKVVDPPRAGLDPVTLEAVSGRSTWPETILLAADSLITMEYSAYEISL